MNIFEFLKNLNPKLILEIGAHFGTETRIFREILPDCEIICFEPDPRNINILKQNEIDRICRLEEFAVSNQTGTMEFHLSSGDCKHWANDEVLRNNDWSASSSLKKPKLHLQAHPWVKFENTIEVKTIRLDDYEPIKDRVVDFIWMDVQGAEDLVFEGSLKSLENIRYIYTEYSNIELYEKQSNLNQILNILGSNWTIMYTYQNDVLLKNLKYEN
jgi:FkbM family methyltransferase